MSNRGFRITFVIIENVGCASIGSDCMWGTGQQSTDDQQWIELPLHIGACLLTSPVDGEVEVFDRTELSEDFMQVVLVDVLGESLYNDLFSGSQLEI
jgi:hypothetical protein